MGLLSIAYLVSALLLAASEDPWVFDAHNDLAYQILRGAKRTHTDIARLKAGNVGAVFFAAYVPAAYAKKPGGAPARAREVISVIRRRIIDAHPDTYVLARTADEVEAARRAGKIAALIGIEGGHAVDDRPELLTEFYNAGVRYMTLTHSNTNLWADSSGDKPRHNGLSARGREMVAEMNRLGMIVDVSHVSDKTFHDVLAVSRAPVFASHSSCRALADHPRNMTDDMIRAMAAKGGVIQINFACDYVDQKYLDATRRKPKPKRIPPPPLESLVRQIEHAVRIAGFDGVGIGSDFDGIDCAPVGIDDVSKFPNLNRALRARGFTDAQLRQLYHGNTLRLMRAVVRAKGSSTPRGR